jgi:hypothetical protein
LRPNENLLIDQGPEPSWTTYFDSALSLEENGAEPLRLFSSSGIGGLHLRERLLHLNELRACLGEQVGLADGTKGTRAFGEKLILELYIRL